MNCHFQLQKAEYKSRIHLWMVTAKG